MGSTGSVRVIGRLSRRRIVAIILIGVVASALWWLTRSGDPFAKGTRLFDTGGIVLSYPAGWTVQALGWPSSGFGSTFAIIGTEPWGLCLPTDLNCHYQVRLEPGQISVGFSSGQMPGPSVCEIGVDRSDLANRGPTDPAATGRLMRVDGRPTLQTDYAVNQLDYYHSDEWRKWVIAAPGSTRRTFVIDAMYRGPGVPAFRQQLDDMIASLRFSNESVELEAGPHDCGAPFP